MNSKPFSLKMYQFLPSFIRFVDIQFLPVVDVFRRLRMQAISHIIKMGLNIGRHLWVRVQVEITSILENVHYCSILIGKIRKKGNNTIYDIIILPSTQYDRDFAIWKTFHYQQRERERVGKNGEHSFGMHSLISCWACCIGMINGNWQPQAPIES